MHRVSYVYRILQTVYGDMYRISKSRISTPLIEHVQYIMYMALCQTGLIPVYTVPLYILPNVPGILQIA